MAIKVLHIFPPSLLERFGGQNIWWKSVFSRWNDCGVAHFVLDFSTGQFLGAQDAFNFRYSKVQNSVSRWERGRWIFSLFRNLIKHKGEYDILHVHVLWWGSLLIAPWTKWQGIPALYESILLDSDTPGGIIREKLGKVKIYLLKFYKGILAISDFLAEDYKKFGFSNQQVCTLTNCVDVDLFFSASSEQEKLSLRQRLDLPSDAKILVFVGSVIKRKGVDLLIRAFISASVKQPELYLLIVGPKNKQENPSLDDDFVNNLHMLIDQNNLSRRVSFMGLIQDRRQLAEIYQASDIFVFPSRNEGLGNVVLEAMSTGLPVIVSQLPVLESIIVHEKNGLFVPVGDVEALEKAIVALSAEPELAQKLGCAARKDVQTAHGFMHWQALLVDFYQRLVSRSEE